MEEEKPIWSLVPSIACVVGGSCCQHRAERLLFHCGFRRSGSTSAGTFVRDLHDACRFGEKAQFIFRNGKARRSLPSNQNAALGPCKPVACVILCESLMSSFIIILTSNSFNCRVPQVKTGIPVHCWHKESQCCWFEPGYTFCDVNASSGLGPFAYTYIVSQKQGEMKKYLCWLQSQIEDKLLLSSSSV